MPTTSSIIEELRDDRRWRTPSGASDQDPPIGYNKIFGYYIEVTKANARQPKVHPQADTRFGRAVHHPEVKRPGPGATARMIRTLGGTVP
jgi:hypothetical protein